MRWLIRAVIFVALTVLTQLGGLAYLASLTMRRRLLSFGVLYALVWGVAQIAAPLAGREPLPCTGAPLRMQSVMYCATMRNFVTPELADIAQDAAAAMAARHPGTVTLALDANLPFFKGFPLIPHLSHDDGEKLDFAFYYANADGTYVPAKTRTPIGYFAFENLAWEAATGDPCPTTGPSLRWDLAWLQPLWRAYPLDRTRTADLVRILSDDPRVAKIFVEPHLVDTLGVAHPKVRFQGCRAARHDDHIHIQL